MYMHTVGHSRIVSTGVFLPDTRLTSREIMSAIDSVNRFGIPADWLERTMGISERRTASLDMLPSDMAARAAHEALETASIDPLDIDVIIYAGVVRDYLLEPSTAHVVQDKIKAYNAIAFDVTNACHGFMNGIHLMDALIASGQARRGLIVTGEQGSRYTFKAIDALCQTTDRQAFVRLAGGLSLGDAGAAMIMGPKLSPDSGFMGFMLQSQGQHSRLCTCGKQGDASSLLETDMAQIIEHGIAMLGDMYDVFMKKLGWEPAEIAKFVHHQVGLKVFKHHAKYARISTDIMPNTITQLGNLVTANIPLNLYNLSKNHDVKDGEKVFIAGAGSGLAVSQAGIVWNAA
jgi:acyl-CoA:acyl-CoA alkyltransferase